MYFCLIAAFVTYSVALVAPTPRLEATTVTFVTDWPVVWASQLQLAPSKTAATSPNVLIQAPGRGASIAIAKMGPRVTASPLIKRKAQNWTNLAGDLHSALATATTTHKHHHHHKHVSAAHQPSFAPMPDDQAAPDAGEGAPDESAPMPVTTSAVALNQANTHPGWITCWQVPSNGLATPNKQLYPPDFQAPDGWVCT